MKIILVVLFFFLPPLSFGQSGQISDFIQGDIQISLDPYAKKVKGEVRYKLLVHAKTDSILVDAKNMSFSRVLLNDRKAKFKYSKDQLILYRRFKPGKLYELGISYTAVPKQAMYFIGWGDADVSNNQVWTQGQGKDHSHWVPVVDNMNDKLKLDLSIAFDPKYEVVTNGQLIEKKRLDSLQLWSFNMEKPMSSYLMGLAIGHYNKKDISSSSGIPISLYYYPRDSSRMEPTYRYTKKIFDFLEEEIGVPYPWQNYKQVPVRDFLYAGMENTGTTIYSDGYLIDSTAFVDKNYVNVNAHELAHQWFGNLVTEKDGSHHWLHEGIATYYAHLAERAVFGEDYFNWLLYDTARELQKLSESGGGEALSDPKASSLTFYEKGAWATVILREQVGDTAFRKGIKLFLKGFSFKNATISDFMGSMEASCKCSLIDFKEKWLGDTNFYIAEAMEFLEANSKNIALFNKLQRELTTNATPNLQIIKRYWAKDLSSFYKSKIVMRYFKSLSNDFIKEILKEGDLKVRQAVILSVNSIPEELKESFETLLKDASYITQEQALFKLWISFQEARGEYLNRTRDIVGLPNYNIRTYWLGLALITKDYGDLTSRKNWEGELRAYTSPRYSFEIRQNAFLMLYEILNYSDQNLRDLAEATVHHSWQFRKFARTLMLEFIKDKKIKFRLERIMPELSLREQSYLQTIIK